MDQFSRCPWSPTFLNCNIIFLRDFYLSVLSFLRCVFPFPPLLRQNLRFNKSHPCSSSKSIKSSARQDGKVQQHQARRKLAPMRPRGGPDVRRHLPQYCTWGSSYNTESKRVHNGVYPPPFVVRFFAKNKLRIRESQPFAGLAPKNLKILQLLQIHKST